MILKNSNKSQMVEMLKHHNKFSLIYHKLENVEPIQQASTHQKFPIIPSPYTKQVQNATYGCMGTVLAEWAFYRYLSRRREAAFGAVFVMFLMKFKSRQPAPGPFWTLPEPFSILSGFVFK